MASPKTKSRKTPKKTTDVLAAWCIDRSGSMDPYTQDTIDGFNKFVEEQQAEKDGRCLLSLVLFDNQFEVPIVATDVSEVPALDHSTYYARGSTALYDAIGTTIEGVEQWLANNPSFDGKVIVHIWTDGFENASTRWKPLSVLMAKIAEKQDQGWAFAFMGAGGAAWTEGEQFAQTVGVGNTTQVTNTSSGTRMSYAASSRAVKNLRSSATPTYAGTNSVLVDVASDTKTLAAYGITDAAEALAGTTNRTDDQEEDEE